MTHTPRSEPAPDTLDSLLDRAVREGEVALRARLVASGALVALDADSLTRQYRQSAAALGVAIQRERPSLPDIPDSALLAWVSEQLAREADALLANALTRSERATHDARERLGAFVEHARKVAARAAKLGAPTRA